MNLIEYYSKGITYTEYTKIIEKQVADHAKLSEYTALNITRMKRVDRTFNLDHDQKAQLVSLPNDFEVLVITEGWCGDASQLIPIFQKIYDQMNVPVHYIFRDENKELIQNYLTNGAESIPILIAFDKLGKELFHYGPRPQKGMDMLAEHKAEPEVYTKEEFYVDLQKFYNQDKGQTAVNELISLMQNHL